MKITNKQLYFLSPISALALISMLFDGWFNDIFTGVVVSIMIWSWFIVLVWNNTKERHNLEKENQLLKSKIKKFAKHKKVVK